MCLLALAFLSENTTSGQLDLLELLKEIMQLQIISARPAWALNNEPHFLFRKELALRALFELEMLFNSDCGLK